MLTPPKAVKNIEIMGDLNEGQPIVTAMPPAILPGNPPTPCPDLLTAEEAIRYLRLDCNCQTRGDLTLRRYRELGILRGTRVGRHIRYRRVELEKFLAKKTENHSDSR